MKQSRKQQARETQAYVKVWSGVRIALAAIMLAALCATPAAAQVVPDVGAPETRAEVVAATSWTHENSDIAPDPAVRFGALSNGMRYALMRNQLPPGAVSIRFGLSFGSIHEAENEQGLAHFIEHMAFNGSTNVPEGEMVKILERLGLSFGADTNASTGQYDTTYMLDLPKASDELLEESLFLIRETASELTFSEGAIDRERGVVLSEHRRGDTFRRRRSQQQLDFLIPGALAAERMPIGSAEVIEQARRDDLVSLYDRYYRPERAVLVIVGDIDVDQLEAKVIRRFSDWTGRGPAGDDPDEPYVLTERPSAASVFVHPDGGDSISAYVLTPRHDPPDTTAARRDNILLDFATSALSRRLSILSNQENPPFRRAAIGRSSVLRAADAATASVSVTPGAWRRGLAAVEQEWRSALIHGFTDEEIAQQIESTRTYQTNAAAREGTRTTDRLAAQLISSIQDDMVFATPSSGLERFRSWIDDVTPETVHDIFVRRMPMSEPLFFLASTVESPGAETAIIEAWKESKEVSVGPPAAHETAAFAYTDFGSPGEVVEDQRLADIDARLVRFSNNVRLNIKSTEFQDNVVQVSVRIGAGALDLEDAPFGLSQLMRAYGDGGLEAHSSDELREILNGRSVQTGLTASTTAFGGSYTTTPADLELQLQVAAAFLTAPGYRAEAERRWRENLVLAWPRFDADASSVLANEGMRILASGDRRLGAAPDDGVVERTFEELKRHVAPILGAAPIEIAIVGDIDEEIAINAVAKTFGALPERSADKSRDSTNHPLSFREDRTPLALTHAGEPTQAIVGVFWPVSVDPDVESQEVRILSVLSAVMRLKVLEEVRESLGAAYSPTAGLSAPSAYPGWGYLSAMSEVRPEDANEVAEVLASIATDLREGKISEDEFRRAITPALEQLPRNATSNAYWLSVMAQAQTRPDRMERAKLWTIESSLNAITIDDLVAAARRWMSDGAMQRVTVLPEADE